MIVLTVTYCLLLNPYFCRELQMSPYDNRAITSVTDCLQGGVIGGMNFQLEDAAWFTRKMVCEQLPDSDASSFSATVKEHIK